MIRSSKDPSRTLTGRWRMTSKECRSSWRGETRRRKLQKKSHSITVMKSSLNAKSSTKRAWKQQKEWGNSREDWRSKVSRITKRTWSSLKRNKRRKKMIKTAEQNRTSSLSFKHQRTRNSTPAWTRKRQTAELLGTYTLLRVRIKMQNKGPNIGKTSIEIELKLTTGELKTCKNCNTAIKELISRDSCIT